MAYNMKDQLAVGKLGEQVAIDYVKKSCALGRLSFESYEDVRSIKTYQEQDIDFLIHRKDGRTVTLDAKTDTYTTGNIFLEQAVDSYLFDENGNVINCNPVTNESTLHHSDGWLYKNANCIFYYFSSTKMLYVFHRVNAALYATELLDAGHKLEREKRPFPRAAENHEKGRPFTKYYGIGLLLPAEQMLHSERMQGHMWKWRVEQDATGHYRFIPVKTRKFVKNL